MGSDGEIYFEFGKGGSDTYDITPETMFSFLAYYGYKVNLLNRFLADEKCMTLEGFENEYDKGFEYFFIAYQ